MKNRAIAPFAPSKSVIVTLAGLALALAAYCQSESYERDRAIRVTPPGIAGGSGTVVAQAAVPPAPVRPASSVTITGYQAGAVAPNPFLPGKQPPSVNLTRSYTSSGFGGGGGGSSSGGSGGIPPLVVRFSGGDDETNASLEEDLTIMTHLIERALQHGIGGDEAVGIKILYSEGGRSVRGMYLDGFGAVFMIKVRFPVFAVSQPEPTEPQKVSDSEWDKAKRELYSETEDRGVELTMAGAGPQYDEEKVEELKKALLQTLKYASNIHNLKANDFVAITVFGQPSTALQVRKARAKNASSTPAAGNYFTPARPESTPAPNGLDYPLTEQKVRAGIMAKDTTVVRVSPQGTVLTLRAKKADVEAFATGKLDFDAFQKKTEQTSYAGSGYGITSINSWSKGPNSGVGVGR